MKSTQEITRDVQELGRWIPALREQVSHVVVGQKYLVDRLLLGLLANGHILLEGVPGLAKTLTVKTMAAAIQTGFQRLQFTPDLLPADLIGTLIYNPRTGEFTTKLGPIFSNLILADEINRAPAKVQSALLEAMQERQVTIGEQTYPLSDPFLVLATQNPIEQEGTFLLPEAQKDRFLMRMSLGYPSLNDERHHVTVSGIVDLPKGFQLSPILQFGSARPYNVTNSSNTLNTGGGTANAVVVPNSDPTNYLKFAGNNAGAQNCFYGINGAPQGCTIAKYDPLRGDPFFELDMRLAKNIKFGERMNLQLLAQAFNLTNRANYGNNFGVGSAASIADAAHFGHPQGFIAPASTIIPHALWGEMGVRFTF